MRYPEILSISVVTLYGALQSLTSSEQRPPGQPPGFLDAIMRQSYSTLLLARGRGASLG
jgi:hypothetical protein